MANQQSGAHEIARAPSVGQIESACDEIDFAVAELAVCIGLLSQRDATGSESAAADAQVAMRRICGVVDALRTGCDRARASTSDRALPEPPAWAAARRRF